METRIRNATLSDLPSLLEFARSLGRRISTDEVRTWLQVDPKAFFVAEAAADGKLVGACCATRLTPELGFMGFYVVLEECRGRGIGSKLWKTAKEHLGDRNIGVHGYPANFLKYRDKEGFCHVEDYAIIYYECSESILPNGISWPSDIEVATYYEGNLIGCHKKATKGDESEVGTALRKAEREEKFQLSETSIKTNIKKKQEPSTSTLTVEQHDTDKLSEAEHFCEEFSSSVTIEDTFTQSADNKFCNAENQTEQNTKQNRNEIEEIPSKSKNPDTVKISKAENILSGVVAFDKSLHNRDRSLVVRQTFSWSSCRSKVALVEGKVVGYACLRNVVTENWIISPFYADTEEVAEILLFELLREFNFSLAPKGILIRPPDKNISCQRLVEKFGFRKLATHVLTGFTKHCVNVDSSKVYSFHSTIFCCE